MLQYLHQIDWLDLLPALRVFYQSRPLPIFLDFGEGLVERDGVIRVGLGGVIGFERFQFFQFLKQSGVLVHNSDFSPSYGQPTRACAYTLL